MEITKDTRIGDVIGMFPEAMPAFQDLGMLCIGCAMASGETIEQACYVHGIVPDAFLDMLEDYLGSL
ncbi:MAG: DUF1858 domain-containing protein [Oscillospiraceae bacterium]|nr:DUF1858 domain-containing protein [Oscillospiraceae bacterium]